MLAVIKIGGKTNVAVEMYLNNVHVKCGIFPLPSHLYVNGKEATEYSMDTTNNNNSRGFFTTIKNLEVMNQSKTILSKEKNGSLPQHHPSSLVIHSSSHFLGIECPSIIGRLE